MDSGALVDIIIFVLSGAATLWAYFSNRRAQRLEKEQSALKIELKEEKEQAAQERSNQQDWMESELTTINQGYREVIEQHKQIANQYKEQVDTQQATINDMRVEQNKQRQRFEEISNAYQDEVLDVRRQLLESQTDLKRIQHDNEEILNKLRLLETEREMMITATTELEKQVEKSGDKITIQQSEIAKLEGRLQEQRINHSAEVDRLQRRVSEMDTALASSKVAFDKLQMQLELERTQSKSREAEYQRRLDLREQTIADLNTNVADLERRIVDMSARLNAYEHSSKAEHPSTPTPGQPNESDHS